VQFLICILLLAAAYDREQGMELVKAGVDYPVRETFGSARRSTGWASPKPPSTTPLRSSAAATRNALPCS